MNEPRVQARLPGSVRCRCLGRAKQDTDWRPGRGYEQSMRRFVCDKGHTSYRNTWLEGNQQQGRYR